MSNNKDFIAGREFYKKKLYNEAVTAFSKAIEKEENPYIYYERALSFLYLEKNNKALDDLNTAAELQPDNPFRYSSRAYVKDKMGDVKGAIEDYRACIELDPDDAVAHNNLGLLEEKMGRKTEAEKLVKRADYLAGSEQFKKENYVKGVYPQHGPKGKRSAWQIVKSIFSSGKGFREFLTFVRKGFKL